MTTSSTDGIQNGMAEVAAIFSRKFSMSLKCPLTIDFLEPEKFPDFQPLSTSGGSLPEYLRLEAGRTHHRIVTISKMPDRDMWTYLARAFGYFWWFENHPQRGGGGEPRGGGDDEEAQGFGGWMEFKFLVEYGSDDAKAFLNPQAYRNKSLSRVSQFLTLEKDYGEYGVLYYVVHGVPPSY